MSKLRDTAERLFWTVVSVGLGNITAAGLFGLAAWKAAAITGLSAGVNLLSILARRHVDALPAPGDGLPGLPTDDTGETAIWTVVGVLVAVALLIWIVNNLTAGGVH